MQLRAGYNYDVRKASDEAGYVEDCETLAIQSMAEEADINVIMKRFGVTGTLPQGARVPEYGDFSNMMDFKSAQNALRQATESFMALDANIRRKFHDDPAEFVEFCLEKDNLPEMRKLGLAVPEVIVDTTGSTVVEGKKDGKNPVGSNDGDVAVSGKEAASSGKGG